MSDEKPLTMSVPQAGKKYYGLSKNGSYLAAERGDIPTIPVGRLLKVPVRAMEAILDNPRKGKAKK
jgi:hypothetical protein